MANKLAVQVRHIAYSSMLYGIVISLAATDFFKQAIDGNGLTVKWVMDKNNTNLARLQNINALLVLPGLFCPDGRHLPSQILQ